MVLERCLRDLQPSTVLNSREGAIAFATSGRDWESFRLEQRNELSVLLHEHAMDRFRKRNEITAGTENNHRADGQPQNRRDLLVRSATNRFQ